MAFTKCQSKLLDARCGPSDPDELLLEMMSLPAVVSDPEAFELKILTLLQEHPKSHNLRLMYAGWLCKSERWEDYYKCLLELAATYPKSEIVQKYIAKFAIS